MLDNCRQCPQSPLILASIPSVLVEEQLLPFRRLIDVTARGFWSDYAHAGSGGV